MHPSMSRRRAQDTHRDSVNSSSRSPSPRPHASPAKRRRVGDYSPSITSQVDASSSRERCLLSEDVLVLAEESSADDKPIYWLDDFEFHDPETTLPVQIDKIFDDPDSSVSGLEGSGLASPLVLDDWDDDSGNGDAEDVFGSRSYTPLRLGALFSYHVDLGIEAASDSPWQLDSDRIWVQTEYAHYILMRPQNDYLTVYRTFYKPRRLAQLVVHYALDSPSADRDAFEVYLELCDDDGILGRPWKLEDLQSDSRRVAAILRAELEDVDNAQLCRALESSPLVRSFMGKNWSVPQHEEKDDDPVPLQVVTPIVHRHARPYFRLPWTVANGAVSSLDTSDEDEDFAYSDSRPSSPTATDIQELDVEMDEPCEDDDSRFARVTWNGVVYRAHDVVKVRGSATDGSGSKVHELWFGRVVYFFEKRTAKDLLERYRFHVEWFNRASAILGPLGSPHELFALDSCNDDVCLGVIIGPPVSLLQPVYPLASAPPAPFCTYFFSAAGGSASFVHLLRCAGRDIVGSCYVCSLREQRAQERGTDGVMRRDAVARRIRGTMFHLRDFVFLSRVTKARGEAHNPLDGGVSPVAQIVRFSANGTVHVGLWQRTGANGAFGERELSFSGKSKNVPADDIARRCRVQLERPSDDLLVRDPWLFFVADAEDSLPKNFRACDKCSEEEQKRQALSDAFDAHHSQRPLTMLDPYSGAGGLTLGIERGSQCVETRYAIDIDESAAKTFQANNPGATVFHADASEFLAAAYNGRKLRSLDGHKELLESRVDMICAGVPCQGHSGLNIHRKAEHQNNNQILTALSLVELYRPQFFCLENVPAIANWRLLPHKQGRHKSEGGIPHGGLRLTIAVLLALGFQLRVGLLQAGHHGTPQRRRRFFLLAANAKSSLPNFPYPTAAFVSTKGLKLSAFAAKTMSGSEASDEEQAGDGGLPLCVPHSFVSVQNAIGDLHEFDWDSNEPEGSRPVFRCSSADGCKPSFTRPYASQPQNEYQLRSRLTNPPVTFDDLQHVTSGYPEAVVESVTRLSRERNADYRGMGALRQQQFQTGDPASAAGRRGFAPGIYYRRLEPDGVFSTLVTKVYPTGTQSQVILPTQSRLISVREMARGQGFPDNYRFEGKIRDMQKQLGNAVPVPLGEAIGREIRASMLKDWVEKHV